MLLDIDIEVESGVRDAVQGKPGVRDTIGEHVSCWKKQVKPIF